MNLNVLVALSTLAELWEVDYVKMRALGKMYRYLYE